MAIGSMPGNGLVVLRVVGAGLLPLSPYLSTVVKGTINLKSREGVVSIFPVLVSLGTFRFLGMFLTLRHVLGPFGILALSRWFFSIGT